MMLATRREVMNEWYAFRSAMIWNPPFNEMICLLMCFCRMLRQKTTQSRSREHRNATYAINRIPTSW